MRHYLSLIIPIIMLIISGCYSQTASNETTATTASNESPHINQTIETAAGEPLVYYQQGTSVQRMDHAMALTNNSAVLIVGGYWASALFGRGAHSSAELYIPHQRMELLEAT